MPQPPLAVVEIESEIEDLVEQRLIIQADRSFYRRCELACTEKMKWIRDRIAELEQILLAPPVVFAT